MMSTAGSLGMISSSCYKVSLESIFNQSSTTIGSSSTSTLYCSSGNLTSINMNFGIYSEVENIGSCMYVDPADLDVTCNNIKSGTTFYTDFKKYCEGKSDCDFEFS